MALVNKYTTRSGVDLPAAYFRVVSVTVAQPMHNPTPGASGPFTSFMLDIYASAAARVASLPAVERVSINSAVVLPAGGAADMLAAAYLHLKLLPQFSGAVDAVD